MKIEVYEPISVTIEYDYDTGSLRDIHTAIVSVGNTEIYRESIEYMPEPGQWDYEDSVRDAKNHALIPLANHLKEVLGK